MLAAITQVLWRAVRRKGIVFNQVVAQLIENRKWRATSPGCVLSPIVVRCCTYIRIVHVHTLCLPSFPPWCSAYSRETKVRHVPSSFRTKKRKRKKTDASSSCGALYYSNTMYCDKSSTRDFSFFPFFMIAKQASLTRERNKIRYVRV